MLNKLLDYKTLIENNIDTDINYYVKVNFTSVIDIVNSLNGFFNVIDFTTDKISSFSDKLVDLISSAIGKISTKKSKRGEEDEEEYE